MSKKIDQRLPQNTGKGVLPEYTSIKSPWEKLVGFQEAMHYVARYGAVVGAAVMQAYRILIPDYETRTQIMCEEAYKSLVASTTYMGKPYNDGFNIHPFCRGNFVGGLNGDQGDEGSMMPGRVQDFGTYRVEKELDVCYWDIVGTELCRATTMSLQGAADAMGSLLRKGPRLEFCMVEAKGCGDRHCRIVAESRDKYPMPEHELWESFGPIATADQIKHTPEEECKSQPMMFREECEFRYSSGTNMEKDATSATNNAFATSSTLYILPAIDAAVSRGIITDEFATLVLRCVCEAAGKTAWGEPCAIEAMRHKLGVPADVNDGRVLGGHIEMYLQSTLIPYEVEAFNKDEVIYTIDTTTLSYFTNRYADCLISYWYGMAKTLVSAQWSLWEEDSPEGKKRIKIAKKIDKFC